MKVVSFFGDMKSAVKKQRPTILSVYDVFLRLRSQSKKFKNGDQISNHRHGELYTTQ